MLGEAYEPEITRRIREANEKGIKSGIELGNEYNKIDLIIKKVKKGKTLFQTANEMEASEAEIRPYYNAVLQSAPEYKIDVIIAIKQGIEQKQIDLIIKKVKKGKSLSQTANEMEASEEEIQPYYNAVLQSAPEYKMDDIVAALHC